MTVTPCCQACAASQNLLRCSSCKVVRYCSKDHQVSDWAQHKSACNAIKASSACLRREEQKLRDHPPGDDFEPGNVFEEQVGYFWGLLHTRPYMRARYAVVEAIMKVRTYDAVVAALDHVMDCMRLNRSDNMGVRDFAPSLMLRLGRDQECYDFVKWWATEGSRGDYDFGDADLPFLNVKDADVLETPQEFCGQYLDLSHSVSVALVKAKLLLAVRAGPEGVEMLRSSQSFHRIEDREETEGAGNEHVELVKVLKSQVSMLYHAVHRANPHFWAALIEPGSHLGARPEYTSPGTKEEMQMALKQSYDAWKETSGAIEVIKALS